MIKKRAFSDRDRYVFVGNSLSYYLRFPLSEISNWIIITHTLTCNPRILFILFKKSFRCSNGWCTLNKYKRKIYFNFTFETRLRFLNPKVPMTVRYTDGLLSVRPYWPFKICLVYERVCSDFPDYDYPPMCLIHYGLHLKKSERYFNYFTWGLLWSTATCRHKTESKWTDNHFLTKCWKWSSRSSLLTNNITDV